MNTWEDIANKDWRAGFVNGVMFLFLGELVIVLAVLVTLLFTA